MILHEILCGLFVLAVIAQYEATAYLSASWAQHRYSPAAIRERERAREAPKPRHALRTAVTA